MKNTFKIIAPILVGIMLSSCNDNSDNNVSYPKTISYKNDGTITLEYWKSGQLQNLNPNDYTIYFDSNSCGDDFLSETDKICKETKIVFKNDTDLSFSYSTQTIDAKYKFVNDTLKISTNNTDYLDLGVGNRNKLAINGSLYKYSTLTTGGCGGDEYHKFNFNGQFFLNKNYRHSVMPSESSLMQANDIVIFYNKEYILE